MREERRGKDDRSIRLGEERASFTCAVTILSTKCDEHADKQEHARAAAGLKRAKEGAARGDSAFFDLIRCRTPAAFVFVRRARVSVCRPLRPPRSTLPTVARRAQARTRMRVYACRAHPSLRSVRFSFSRLAFGFSWTACRTHGGGGGRRARAPTRLAISASASP